METWQAIIALAVGSGYPSRRIQESELRRANVNRWTCADIRRQLDHQVAV